MAFGLRLSSLTRAEIVDLIIHEPVRPHGGAQVVCTANLDHIVQLRNNEGLRTAYDAAWCITADGMPVYLYARLKRENVPSRVTGSDLVRDLITNLPVERNRCYFVASCTETVDGIQNIMVNRGFASEVLMFVVPPFGFEKDEAWSNYMADSIHRHRATHVFFGIGAPKSEIWTHRYREALGDCYVLNVGAGLDYACGVKRRAPIWMQQSGLEWAWRFAQEPTRLYKRYFIDSWKFLNAIRDDLATTRKE